MAVFVITLAVLAECPRGLLISEFGCVDRSVCEAHRFQALNEVACVRNCSQTHTFNSRVCDRYCVYPYVKQQIGGLQTCVLATDLRGKFFKNGQVVAACGSTDVVFSVGNNKLCVDYGRNSDILPEISIGAGATCKPGLLQFRPDIIGFCPDFDFLPAGLDFLTVQPLQAKHKLKSCPNSLICLSSCPYGTAGLAGVCTLFDQATELYGVGGVFVTGCEPSFKENGFCVDRCQAGRCANSFGVCVTVPLNLFIAQNGSCVSDCSTLFEGAQCVDNCSSNYGISADSNPKECVSSAPGKFLFNNNWISDCTPNYAENDRCVIKCSLGFGFIPPSRICIRENSTSLYLQEGVFVAQCDVGKKLDGRRCVDVCSPETGILDRRECLTSSQLSLELQFAWSGYQVVAEDGSWAIACSLFNREGQACVKQCSFELAVASGGFECVSDSTGSLFIEDNVWVSACTTGRFIEGRYCVLRCTDWYGYVTGSQNCRAPVLGEFIDGMSQEITGSCSQKKEIRQNATRCVVACSQHYGTLAGGDTCVSAEDQPDTTLFLSNGEWTARPCVRFIYNQECLEQCPYGTGFLVSDAEPRQCYVAADQALFLDVDARYFVISCASSQFTLVNATGRYCLARCAGAQGYYKSALCRPQPVGKVLANGQWVEHCAPTEIIENGYKCVQTCSDGFRLYAGACIVNSSMLGCKEISDNVVSAGKCATNCPSDTAIGATPQECVANPGLMYKMGNKWVSNCGVQLYYGSVCYSKCPSGTARNGSSLRCYSTAEIYVSGQLAPFVAKPAGWQYVCGIGQFYVAGMCVSACPENTQAQASTCQSCGLQFYYPDTKKCTSACTASYYEFDQQCLVTCDPHFYFGQECVEACSLVSDQYYEVSFDKKRCVASCSLYNGGQCVNACDSGQFINQTNGTDKCVWNCTTNIYRKVGGALYCVEYFDCTYMTFDTALGMYECIVQCEFALPTQINGVTVCYAHLPVGKYFTVVALNAPKLLSDSCSNFAVVSTRQCVTACPPYLFAKGKMCHSFCDQFVVLTHVSGAVAKRECVNTCPGALPYFDAGKACVATCDHFVTPNGQCVDNCLAFDGTYCQIAEDDYETRQLQIKTTQCQGMHASLAQPGCMMNGVIHEFAGANVVSINDFALDGGVYFVMDANNSQISAMNLYVDVPGILPSAGQQLAIFRHVHNVTFKRVHVWGIVGSSSLTVSLVFSGSNVQFLDSRFALNAATQNCFSCTNSMFSLAAAPAFTTYTPRAFELYGRNYRILAPISEPLDSVLNRTAHALNLTFLARANNADCFAQGDQFCYVTSDGITHELIQCHGATCTYQSLTSISNYSFSLSCTGFRLGYECVSACPVGYLTFRHICVLFCPFGYSDAGGNCVKDASLAKTDCPVGYQLQRGVCIEDDGTASIARPPCGSKVQQGWTCVDQCSQSYALVTLTGVICVLCDNFYQTATRECANGGKNCVVNSMICPLTCSSGYTFNYASLTCMRQLHTRRYTSLVPDLQCSQFEGSQQVLNSRLYCVHACKSSLVSQESAGNILCQDTCDAGYFKSEYRSCLSECPVVAQLVNGTMVCAGKCSTSQFLSGRTCVSTCVAPLFEADKPEYSRIFNETYTTANYTQYLAKVLAQYNVRGQCVAACSTAPPVYNLTNCNADKTICTKQCRPTCKFVRQRSDGYECLWPSNISQAVDGTQFFTATSINGNSYFLEQSACAVARRVNAGFQYDASTKINFVECTLGCQAKELHSYSPADAISPVMCVSTCRSGSVINKRVQDVGGVKVSGYFCDKNTELFDGYNFLTYYVENVAPGGVSGLYSGEKCENSVRAVSVNGKYYQCRQMSTSNAYDNVFASSKVFQTKNCVSDCKQYYLEVQCFYTVSSQQFVVRRTDADSGVEYFVCYASLCPAGVGRRFQYSDPRGSSNDYVECFDSCQNQRLQSLSGLTNLMVDSSGACVAYLSPGCLAFRIDISNGVVTERFCDASCGVGNLENHSLSYYNASSGNRLCANSCKFFEALFDGVRFIRDNADCFTHGSQTSARCNSLILNVTDVYCQTAADCPAALSNKYFAFHPLKHCTDCTAGSYGREDAVSCAAECPLGMLADELLRVCTADTTNGVRLQWRRDGTAFKRSYDCADLSASEQARHPACCRATDFVTAERECINSTATSPDVYAPSLCDAYIISPRGAAYPRECVNCTEALERDSLGHYKCVQQCQLGWEYFNPDSRKCLQDRYTRTFSIAPQEVTATPIKQNLYIRETWIAAGVCAGLLLIQLAIFSKVLYDWKALVKPVQFTEMRVRGLVLACASNACEFVVPID